MSNTELNHRVADAIKRAPEWVRHEIGVKDPIARERAEETLAALIVAALSEIQDAA